MKYEHSLTLSFLLAHLSSTRLFSEISYPPLHPHYIIIINYIESTLYVRCNVPQGSGGGLPVAPPEPFVGVPGSISRKTSSLKKPNSKRPPANTLIRLLSSDDGIN